MENASKALIIAGAILLSILIIALGIYVFNMAKGATNTSSIEELNVSQFNQQFTNYRGRQAGSGVIDLLDKVINSGTTNKDADERLMDIVYLDVNSKGKANKSKTGGKDISSNAMMKNAINAAGMDSSKVNGNSFYIESTSTANNLDQVSKLRSNIAESHFYQVGFNTNVETGFIDYIVIQY